MAAVSHTAPQWEPAPPMVMESLLPTLRGSLQEQEGDGQGRQAAGAPLQEG
jgi:hypothetical protein